MGQNKSLDDGIGSPVDMDLDSPGSPGWMKIIGQEKKSTPKKPRNNSNNKNNGTPKKSQFLKKVQRQERVVEEVKLVLKPAYNTRKINKDQYKEILRKAVPKICHSRHGEINPSKIEKLIQGYIKKFAIKKKGDKFNSTM